MHVALFMCKLFPWQKKLSDTFKLWSVHVGNVHVMDFYNHHVVIYLDPSNNQYKYNTIFGASKILVSYENFLRLYWSYKIDIVSSHCKGKIINLLSKKNSTPRNFFLRRDINNQTSKSYKFYLFILRGILKTKIECVFFFEFIPKKFLIRVFFAHSVLCYTYILPKQRAVHKNFVLFFLNGFTFYFV